MMVFFFFLPFHVQEKLGKTVAENTPKAKKSTICRNNVWREKKHESVD